MKRYEYYRILQLKYTDINVFSEIERTCRKIEEHFETHNNILVSVSGGSDSDCIVHLICTYFPEYVEKCRFVFVNTGLEYAATKRHLCDLENRYGITIDRIRGESVVTAVKKYGIPILNKAKSKSLSMYIRDTPKGYYLVFEANGSYYHFTDNERRLARYLKANNIMVSNKCCDVSKKKPIHKFCKENAIDLNVTGERRAEGGQRATAHKSCFHETHDGAKFMPLFWWSDIVKGVFKKAEKIRYSDCYEVYGMRRTGCCGCPYGKYTGEELRIMQKYEPNLYNACMHIFGKAYELTDMFNCRRVKCLPEYWQMEIENA